MRAPRLLLFVLVALTTALSALLRHPLRAALTGFGILVGVAAVTVVITLGEGAEAGEQVLGNGFGIAIANSGNALRLNLMIHQKLGD